MSDPKKTDDLESIRRMNSDEIERIKVQLATMKRVFDGIRKSGIHRDILVAYLYDKGCGVKKTDIVKILEVQDEFYAHLAELAK